jgi:lysophospholipase L1-like esterase
MNAPKQNMKMMKKVDVQSLGIMRRHPRAAKFLLLCVSISLSLVVAEVIVRKMEHDKMQVGRHRLFCEYHPLLGWQKKPNFSGIHVGPEEAYRVVETMNSRGIRGPEYSYEKSTNEFRIVVLGDSFAEGYTVEFPDLFSEVLKRRLNQDYTQTVEVINAGTGGYSTDQELLWFTHEGFRYSPDVVVLLFCLNDILFNTVDRYWRGYKPLFRMDGEALRLTNVPVPLPLNDEFAKESADASTSAFQRVGKWLYDSSVLYRRITDELSQNERLAGIFPWLQKIKEPQKLGAYDNRLFDWGRATQQERQEGLKITAALLAKLKEEVESRGARFLVMMVPSAADVDVFNEIVSICHRQSIDCLNPLPQFRKKYFELKQQGKKLTFAPVDDHWNEEGHRLAAELLYEHLTSRGYLFYRSNLLSDGDRS